MEIVDVLDEVLGRVEFTRPVELADVQSVYAEIRARLPAGASLDGYHRFSDVWFEVRHAGAVYCRSKSVI